MNRALLAALIGLFLAACSSERTGILYDRTGTPVGGTAVRLISVSDDGSEVSLLGTAVTDENGRFTLIVGTQTNASVIAEAELAGGPLRGFWAGSGKEIPLHPLTEALVGLVLDMTSTSGGRSVTDFSAEELRSLADALFSADATGLDLADAAAVKEFVRTHLGRQIALAAGGQVSVRTTAALAPYGSPETIDFDVVGTPCSPGFQTYPIAGAQFTFDFRKNGSLCGDSAGGLSAMLREGMTLTLPGEEFITGGGFAFPLDGTSTALVGARDLLLGPYAIKDPATGGGIIALTADGPGVNVTRKIHVSSTGDVARYVDILTNPESSDRALNVTVQSTLLTSTIYQLLTFDPDVPLGLATRFVAAYDLSADRPTAGFAFQDGLGTRALGVLNVPGLAGGTPSHVDYGWQDVTIPAGGTLAFVHYLLLTPSRFADNVAGTLKGMTEQPDMEGLTLDELKNLANFTPGNGTVVGEAGSVIGAADVTGLNIRTGEVVLVKARHDGSFFVPLDTQSGDAIHVTASDGLDTMLTVP